MVVPIKLPKIICFKELSAFSPELYLMLLLKYFDKNDANFRK